MGLDNPIHIAFLLILLLLVFGAKRLPEMGRSLGSGMRGFKDSLSGDHDTPALAVHQAAGVAPVADVHAAPQPVPGASLPVREQRLSA
jgi:sec-independent protein translocase protein TatA